MSGKGVVSFISNFSYLGEPSFVVMRQRFLTEFDKLWLDCMNGDSRETGKLTPDGEPDPSVFSTDYNREGIRVGTAVCVIVRKPTRQQKPTVRLQHFWGVDKRANLLDSLKAKRFNAAYTMVDPTAANRHSFRPENVADEYSEWPKLTELCAVAPFNGPVERRGGSLISIDRTPLESRIRAYFDSTVPDSEVAAYHPSLMMTGNRIVGPDARKKLLKEHSFSREVIVRYPFKVMDVRWAYLANIRPLFSEPSPHLLNQRFEGNAFFISRDTADKTPEGPPFYYSGSICDYDSISGHARHFPIRVKNGRRLEKDSEATLFAALGDKPASDEPVANLSAAARQYVESLKFKNPDEAQTARILWMHSLAIGYSPAYLSENADGIRRDWPRIPLPADRSTLRASAALGEQIAVLLDTEAEVPGVTCGKIAPVFKTIGLIAKAGGGQLDPSGSDLVVTARWGIYQPKAGAVMPGEGKCQERQYDDEEAKAIDTDATARGMSAKDARRLLGERTCDVWGYYIGRVSGCQEMAELSRGGHPWPGDQTRRGPRGHEHGPPNCGHPPVTA
jgi:hypothetical protein